MEKSRADLQLVVGLITCYQRLWSAWRPPSCRFYPSCSEYAKQAFQTYGFWKGLLKATGRIARCHPWHPGGIDEV